MEGCGLTAAALAPLPLWLPRTRQLDLDAGRRLGSAARRLRSRGDPCDRARGRAFRGCSRADTGAMDSVGGHAAGADKPGASGADIPGVQALLRALETARPARIVWIGGIPPWWPHDMPAEQGREIEAGADVAPGWLPRGGRGGVIKWAAIAATVDRRPAVAGMVNAASPNCARTCMAVATGVPSPLARVTDLAPGPPAARRSRAIGVFLLGASAFATGGGGAMRTARWMWRWRPARRDRRPEGGTPDWIKAAAKDGVSVEPQAAAGLRARRHRARHPRAAASFAFRPRRRRRSRQGASASRTGARAPGIIGSERRASPQPVAPAGAGRAVLAGADRACAGQAERSARAELIACAASIEETLLPARLVSKPRAARRKRRCASAWSRPVSRRRPARIPLAPSDARAEPLLQLAAATQPGRLSRRTGSTCAASMRPPRRVQAAGRYGARSAGCRQPGCRFWISTAHPSSCPRHPEREVTQ